MIKNYLKVEVEAASTINHTYEKTTANIMCNTEKLEVIPLISDVMIQHDIRRSSHSSQTGK